MSAWERMSAEFLHGSTIRDEAGVPPALAPLPPALLEEEASFYGAREWCLDAFPTVQDVRRRLLGEIESLEAPATPWQLEEGAANVYLLACALSDAVDDYLAGARADFSAATAWLPILRPIAAGARVLLGARRYRRGRRLRSWHAWRARWASALDAVLQDWLGSSRVHFLGRMGASKWRRMSTTTAS